MVLVNRTIKRLEGKTEPDLKVNWFGNEAPTFKSKVDSMVKDFEMET